MTAMISSLNHQHVPKAGDYITANSRSAVLTVAVELARAQIRSGGNARLSAPRGGVDREWSGPPVDEVLAGKQPNSLPQRGVDLLLGRVTGSRTLSERAYSGLRLSPDRLTIIHNYPGAVLAALGQGPVVLHVHNDALRSFSRRELVRLDSRLDAVVAVSSDLASRLPAIRTPIVVQINGVAPDIFYPATRQNARLRVAFVGRIISEKGPDIFVRAANLLKDRDIDWFIIGSGSVGFRDRMSKFERELLAASRSGGASITWIRDMKRADLPEFLRNVDVLTIPSVWNDPCPLTVGEGMASGVAVVASDIGGIPEFGADGITLISPGDARELATAVDSLYSNPQLLREAKERAVARSLEVSWDSTLKSLACSLAEVL